MEKPYICHNRCRKSIWQNSAFFLTKILSKLVPDENYLNISKGHRKSTAIASSLTLRNWKSLPSGIRSKACRFVLTISFFFLFFFFSRAVPMAYGNSQARGRVGATAVGLHPSTAMQYLSCVCDLHRNSGQCQILNPLSEAKGWNPCPHGSQLASLLLSHDRNSLFSPFLFEIVLEVLASAISQKKKKKKKKEFKGRKKLKKEGEKKVLFADIIIIFVDNPWTLKK